MLAQTDAHSELMTYSIDQILSPYVWVFFAAFLVAFLFTPIMRKLALANGIIDMPDYKRKAHLEPIAYLGGVALFLGWIAGISVAYMITPHNAKPGIPSGIDLPGSIILGAFVITIVGLIDDVANINPRIKIGGQLFAAGALASQNVGTSLAAGLIKLTCSLIGLDPTTIPGFGTGGAVDPAYWIGAGLVMFLVLGGCNATNLIDGLDGLASGVTGIVALGLTAISVYIASGYFVPSATDYSFALDPVRIVLCLALLGTVLGFLPYNFNPASIFMGDTGSMLLGYLCISIILLFAERETSAPLLIMAGLTVFALPIIDTSLAIVRRKSRGQPIFSPDNQHLHHQLIRSGMSVKKAVSWLYLMSGGFALLGFGMVWMRTRFVAALFLVALCFVMVTAWKIGHRQYLQQLLDEKNEADATASKSEDKDETKEETNGDATA